MPEHPLVGTWNLVSYTIINAEGVKLAEPFGPNPQGMLIYTANGFMSGHLMSASRSQWGSDLPHKASPEEKVLAFDTYLGYCGTYEHQGDRVIHHVTTSFFPNWVGTNLIRVVQLDGNLLMLTAPPVTGKGKTRTVQITWRRLEI
jgi:Lipocalin-like domain